MLDMQGNVIIFNFKIYKEMQLFSILFYFFLIQFYEIPTLCTRNAYDVLTIIKSKFFFFVSQKFFNKSDPHAVLRIPFIY